MSRYVFTGIAKIRVIEAESLRATDYSTRIFSNSTFLISPYIHLDIDDVPLGRTATKHRNQNPTFNEEFHSGHIHAGVNLNVTVFHDSALPPDEFVANCSISLHEIRTRIKVVLLFSFLLFFVYLNFSPRSTYIDTKQENEIYPTCA